MKREERNGKRRKRGKRIERDIFFCVGTGVAMTLCIKKTCLYKERPLNVHTVNAFN